jgi:hypothetical protein
MISRELNLADSRFARICSTALRRVFCSSKPKTVAPISPASQKKVQPASWIFRPNSWPSRFWTSLQPDAQGSLSNRRHSGKSVPSLIRIVPVLMVSGIWALLGIYSGTLFGSSWRRRLDVCVGLDLCNWSSFQAAFLMSFLVAGILTLLISEAFRDSRIISTAVQKAVQGSHSNRTDSGKSATSSISLVPVLFVSAIGVSLALTVARRTPTLTALR